MEILEITTEIELAVAMGDQRRLLELIEIQQALTEEEEAPLWRR